MKKIVRIIAALSFAVFAALAWSQGAGDNASKTSPAGEQLTALVEAINGKIQQGHRTEQALSEDLKKFDVLLEKHTGKKTEAVARIQFMKAALYSQVIGDLEKGVEEFEKVQQNFPGTQTAQKAAQVIQQLEMQQKLSVGKKFPDFEAKDLDGDPLSVSKFAGKAVLVDFWATWCGPCIRELPNVIEAYKRFQDQGFEIVGISLDRDREKLENFIAKHNMGWPQYFDGRGWENELAQKYGVRSIPATFLLNKKGVIVAKDLRGDQLEAKLEELLGG